MSYIKYVKRQYSDYKYRRYLPPRCGTDEERETFSRAEEFHRYSQAPKKLPLVLLKPDFMPSYLVRISDMKVIKGSQVHEGYCALSYSWNQSGEILKDETSGNNYRCVDEGKHKIVYPARIVRKKPRGRKRIPRKIKFVKFEGLIQEICKDCNIKYIWYDQMCINQGDADEKHREIHQMHKIYSNAYCTIALIPEMKACRYKPVTCPSRSYLTEKSYVQSQWMKRMWTLEETVMSSRLLLVGLNFHRWWYRLPDDDEPIFYKRVNHTACDILYYAHKRSSTKEHDHIFALANIFPDIMKEIIIDYKQDVHQLMIQFYGALAKRDLSILCFEPYSFHENICEASLNSATSDKNEKKVEYKMPIQKFDLPSWTGVNGKHIVGYNYETTFKNYTVNGRSLIITCSGMTNHQHLTETLALEALTPDDIPRLPRGKIPKLLSIWTLILPVQLPGSMNFIPFSICEYIMTEEDLYCHHAIIVQRLRILSRFITIKIEDLQWIDSMSTDQLVTIEFSTLDDSVEDFSQYTLLIGIPFSHPYDLETWYPVIKKDGNYYKAVGVWRKENGEKFFNDITLEEQTYEIH